MFKFLSIISILLTTQLSYATTFDDIKTIDNECESTNSCLPRYVAGMADTQEESKKNSEELGVRVQWLAHDSELSAKYGFVEGDIAHEINTLSYLSGKYFLKHKEHKGVLSALLVYFPSYKKPYQYDLKLAQTQDQTNYMVTMNAEIEKNTKCNSDGFCNAMLLVDVKYNGENESAPIVNVADFVNFINEQNQENFIFYPSKKEDYIPLRVAVIMGTNGHLSTEKDFNNYLEAVYK